jgi:hypothetical protein
VPVSPKMNRSPIRETLGAGIIAGPCGADTWLPILPVEKQGDLGYNRTQETFHVGSACVAGRRPRGRFFPCRILGRSQAAPRAELDHVNSLREPKDALGRNEYDLVLFEDETEARPILVSLLQQAELP